MSVAAPARHLAVGVAVTGLAVIDVLLGDRLPETGPAGAGVELLVGAEQFIAAGRAQIFTLLVVVPVGAGEGPLGPGLPEHLVVLGGQSSAPFLVGLGKFGLHGSFLPRNQGGFGEFLEKLQRLPCRLHSSDPPGCPTESASGPSSGARELRNPW